MPMLGALFAGMIRYMMVAFIYIFGQQLGIKWAERVFVIGLATAFFVAVTTCVSTLQGAINAAVAGGRISGGAARFVQGVGMFVPSNAVGLIGCVAYVWLACVVYRTKMAAMKVG